MKKRIITIVLGAALSVVMAMPAFAVEYQYGTGSKEIHHDKIYYSDGTTADMRWASGKLQTYPGWAWINGYCYYYTDRCGGNKLTNCTTPDGYTVDAEGRWTINGVPQYNGYGSMVMGTDALYAGKNDEQRWEVMRDRFEKLFAENVEGSSNTIAMKALGDMVLANCDKGGTNGIAINKGTASSPYQVTIQFGGNEWNDCPSEYIASANEIYEQIFKILLGDHVGQEFFNEIRAAADPCEGGAKEVPALDENGNWIFIDSNHIKMMTISESSDGINFAKFDVNKWNNKRTDYGKRIKITTCMNEIGSWQIEILKD